ncbi:MAG TPA: S8 family serine peptidase [Acidimicrobiales bacterium]|nr:S8 family serine peptidase [Acidimicrobiales bacterium]
MAKTTATQQYVLLPPQGLRAKSATTSPEALAFLRTAHDNPGMESVALGAGEVPIRVVDSLGPDGAKLLELSPEAAMSIRADRPDLRLVPVVYYTPAVLAPEEVEQGTGRRGAAAATDITLTVVSKKGSAPVPNAFVVAFVDFKAKTGAQGITGSDGTVSLALGAATIKLDRLYVYPLDANWSLIKKNLAVKTGTTVTLTPLDLSYTDGLRHFYGNADLAVGTGVTVGVVDTGVAAHPDLVIAGGLNTVPGEDPKDFGDNGKAHGTHVAGIIAARGTPPTGLRGVAPGVTLRAYRVFGKDQGSASSFAIAKAVDAAVADKCDLINMSLGGGPTDPVLKAAIDDAWAGGTLCMIAAGNGDRSPISFPAVETTALAVSAVGRKGTFPTSATSADEVAAPYGTDKANFIAAFSNIGPEMDLTGPGVGIMSTVPGSYAEISGTSMACPAATGAAARALAGTPVIKLKRNARRTEAIVKAVLASATSLGFGPTFEGHGLPDPK